jgi:hypothetical protein
MCWSFTGMLNNNDHADSIRLVGIVYVVDGAFGTSTSGLDDLSSIGCEVDITCWVDSWVGLAARNFPTVSVSCADMKDAI